MTKMLLKLFVFYLWNQSFVSFVVGVFSQGYRLVLVLLCALLTLIFHI